MIEVLGTVIAYVYQISVILFVLKEFGFISSPFVKEQKEAGSEGRSESGNGSGGGFDFGGLMQGLMKGIQEQGKPVGKKGKKEKTEEPEGQVEEVD